MGRLGLLKVAMETGEWKPILGVLLLLGAVGCIFSIFKAAFARQDYFHDNNPIEPDKVRWYIIENGIIGAALLVFGLLFVFVV